MKQNEKTKSIYNNIKALIMGLILAFIIFETFLRIFQPFPIAIKSNNLFLKANTKVVYHNKNITGLDEEALNEFNTLGFRGEEIPHNFDSYFSLLAIGGSTTACNTLSEGKDWIHILKNKYVNKVDSMIWVNNAGLNGNSTYGHILLLKEHIIGRLQPNYILYLIGINDIDRKDFEYGDDRNNKNISFNIFDWLKKNCETALLIESVFRYYKGYTITIGKELSDLYHPTYQNISDEDIKETIKAQKPLLTAYEKRIQTIINLTLKAGSQPVFMTQPLLYGETVDPITGADLGKIKTYRFFNGKGYWQVLEAYNEALREVCKNQQVILIDLAQEMPKSSEYYIDSMHFTNKGAEKVAAIIWQEWLSKALDLEMAQ